MKYYLHYFEKNNYEVHACWKDPYVPITKISFWLPGITSNCTKTITNKYISDNIDRLYNFPTLTNSFCHQNIIKYWSIGCPFELRHFRNECRNSAYTGYPSSPKKNLWRHTVTTRAQFECCSDGGMSRSPAGRVISKYCMHWRTFLVHHYRTSCICVFWIGYN